MPPLSPAGGTAAAVSDRSGADPGDAQPRDGGKRFHEMDF